MIGIWDTCFLTYPYRTGNLLLLHLPPIHGVPVDNGLGHPLQIGVVPGFVEREAAVQAAGPRLRDDEGEPHLIDEVLQVRSIQCDSLVPSLPAASMLF